MPLPLRPPRRFSGIDGEGSRDGRSVIWLISPFLGTNILHSRISRAQEIVGRASCRPFWRESAVVFEIIVLSLGGCGVCQTELAAGFGFDFSGRKNELPGDGFGFGLE